MRDAPRTWDFVITCFEPLSNVPGGIGSYTRLLLTLLCKNKDKFPNILAICATEPAPEIMALCPNVHFVVAQRARSLNGVRLEYIGGKQFQFSFGIAELLNKLFDDGHRFKFIEFPDYGVEGYFTIKNIRHGRIAVDRVAVRIHSPNMTLWDDNQRPLHEYSTDCLHLLACELYVYQYADVILYGADAMLKRIDDSCRKFGLNVLPSAVKIHHPYARVESYLSIGETRGAFQLEREGPIVGYVGRLENRKGISLFFQTLCADAACVGLVKEIGLTFLLIGRDLEAAGGKTNGDLIRDAIDKADIRDHVKFAGNVSPNELVSVFLPMCDAFVFPSIFENYPNALIETLHLGRPTLVSERGGMPEVAAPFPNVVKYDPLAPHSAESVADFIYHLRPAQVASGELDDARIIYDDHVDKLDMEIARDYERLVDLPKQPVQPMERDFRGRVGFVVPFYNNSVEVAACLESVVAAARKDDKIVVVDDMSTQDEYESLLTIAARISPRIKVLRCPINSGPAFARNVGASEMEGLDYLQFLDADDIIDAHGFSVTRRVLDNVRDLDMVYGLLKTFGESNYYWLPRDGNSLQVLAENVAHSAVLIKKSVFDELGGFNADQRFHFEDWELYARFCLQGYRSEVVLVPTLMYRVKRSSRTRKNADQLRSSRARVIEHSLLPASVDFPPNEYRLRFIMATLGSRQLLDDASEPGSPPIKESIRNIRQQIRGTSAGWLRRGIANVSLSIVKRVASTKH